MSGPQRAGEMTPEQHYAQAESLLAGLRNAALNVDISKAKQTELMWAQVTATAALAHATLATAVF